MIVRFERIGSICVYCGSRDGAKSIYRTTAAEFGRAMVQRRLRLVYGAGNVGLMGAIGSAVRDQGGETFGVIPRHLIPREGQLSEIGALVITETMHERKKVMIMNADAFVTLPGGGGSMDEFFEVLTWAQLGLHEKPIYLLNIEGYWDRLLDLLDQFVDQGMADKSSRERVRVFTDSNQLLDDIVLRLS